MTNNFSDMLVPFKGLSETDLLELLSDRMSEFLTHEGSDALKFIDDSVALIEVPSDFSIEVNGMLFFEDYGYLSYMSADGESTPLYIDTESLYAPDWRVSAGGASSMRSSVFIFDVCCGALSKIYDDYWYMDCFDDVNALCWALADFYDIEH